jgi:RNA polymerase sigma factor (sigma-70 family)
MKQAGVEMTPSGQRAAPDAEESLAIERLNREFRGSLLRYFSRRARNLDVEDMVQEVFMHLVRRGSISALERENINAYMFETASNVLRDHMRKRKTHRADAHEPFDAEMHGNADFSPEHVLVGKEGLARATAALLELPERTRVIFVLRRLEGMRYNDIAARLAISVSAVEKHMQRAIVHIGRRRDQE